MKKLVAIAFSLLLAPMAMAAQFVEGTRYEVVTSAPVQGQPRITEFFSLGCPHCYNFETRHIPNIKKGLDANVKFEQKHVDFNGVEMVKSLAVMQTLKKEGQLKVPMFKAVQESGKRFATTSELKQFFVDNGVSGDQFDKAANSFMVNSKMKQWKKEQVDMNIRGVPALIVNGKYQVELGGIESVQQMVDLLNYLAKKRD